MSTFSHLNAGGEANMVDVSDKDVTKREATAEGFLYVSEDVIRQISESKIAKGDVFAVARVAGIQGAKRCADLIPLCHPLALSKVDINFDIQADQNRIQAICYCIVLCWFFWWNKCSTTFETNFCRIGLTFYSLVSPNTQSS